MPHTKNGGSKWKWPPTRYAIYLRDGFTCVYCQSSNKLTLDHVIPSSAGGSDEPSNLVTCCKKCNDTKRDASLSWFSGYLESSGHDTSTLLGRVHNALDQPINRKTGAAIAKSRGWKGK